jgi:hypothetical protein
MEEKLVDLLEQKSFDELTNEERVFVLKHLSEEEYRMQHTVFCQLPHLEIPPLTVQPLVIEKEKKALVVPLWQVLAGAACLIIAFVLAYPKNESVEVANSKPVKKEIDTLYVQRVDTVYLSSEKGKNKVVYRTDTVHITEYRTKEVYVNSPENNVVSSPVTKPGTTLKEDRDLGWVPKPINL